VSSSPAPVPGSALSPKIIEESLLRLVDRLRSAPKARLTRIDERLGDRSLASASYEFVCWCASISEAARKEVGAGAERVPPVLHPLATGDQVLVVGRELVSVLSELPSEVAVELDRRIKLLRDVA